MSWALCANGADPAASAGTVDATSVTVAAEGGEASELVIPIPVMLVALADAVPLLAIVQFAIKLCPGESVVLLRLIAEGIKSELEGLESILRS